MDDLNTKVLRAFEIKASHIKHNRGAFIINTPSGNKLIQKMDVKSDQILFTHYIKTWLMQNGFPETDMFYTSATGKPYVSLDGSLYVLTDYFGEQSVSFHENETFLQIIKCVSRMHNILKSIPLFETKIYSANPADEFTKYEADLVKIKKGLKIEGRLSEFDVIVLKNYDYYTNKIKAANELLNSPAIQSYLNTVPQKPTICHNLLKEENIYFKQNHIYITNFIGCGLSCFLLDIENIIRRYSKVLQDKPLTFDRIIDAYCQYNPLSTIEIQTLSAFLTYPVKFVKTAKQYYSKKRSFIPNSMHMRIKNEIAQKEKYYDFLKHI